MLKAVIVHHLEVVKGLHSSYLPWHGATGFQFVLFNRVRSKWVVGAGLAPAQGDREGRPYNQI